jgi:hypothetical protein
MTDVKNRSFVSLRMTMGKKQNIIKTPCVPLYRGIKNTPDPSPAWVPPSPARGEETNYGDDAEEK